MALYDISIILDGPLYYWTGETIQDCFLHFLCSPLNPYFQEMKQTLYTVSMKNSPLSMFKNLQN